MFTTFKNYKSSSGKTRQNRLYEEWITLSSGYNWRVLNFDWTTSKFYPLDKVIHSSYNRVLKKNLILLFEL